MSDQNLKFIISTTYDGAPVKQFNADLAGMVDKAKGAESALVKSGNGFVSLAGAAKQATGFLDGMGVSTVALTNPMYALGAGLKFAIDEAAESQQIMAQTEAVIKSTGGAAGLTAEEIANMAESLSAASTFSDDAIQKGQNLLLTFTGIGKDVFPAATQAMLDMATAMGTDASSGAIQLGKALNDPAAGITALTRVGVVFTEEQKKLIKSLVETGDVAGAQKIILAELNREFGGSAAAAADTYAGKMDRFTNSVGNLGEKVGNMLLPALSEGAEGMTKFVDLLSEGVEVLDLLVNWSDRLTDTLAEHADEVQNTAESYEDYATELKRAADAAGYSVDEQGNLTRTVITTAGAYKEVVQTGYLVSESMFRINQMAELQDGHLLALSQQTGETAESLRDLAMADEEVIAKAQAKAQQMILNAALSGTLTDAQNDYKEEVAKSNQTIAEMTAKLNELTAQQGQAVRSQLEMQQLHQKIAEAKAKETAASNELWQAQQNLNDNTDPDKQVQLADAVSRAQLAYDGAVLTIKDAVQAYGDAGVAVIDNSDKIADLNAKLDEARQSAADANVEMHQLTNEFIFQKAAADLDAGAALELARQLGLIDEKSYAAAVNVQQLRDKYDTSGEGAISAAEAANGYIDAVARLADQINGLQDRTVTVSYIEEYREATGGGRAHGGPVESGKVYEVNETPGVGPEYFIPSSNGYMLNQSQAQAALAGGAPSSAGGSMSSLSIGSVQINNGMDQAMFEAMMRRAFVGG